MPRLERSKTISAWILGALLLMTLGCQHSATCADACSHYLSCAGASTAYQPQCVAACGRAPGATPAWLNEFVMTDCATAVAMIDGPGTTPGAVDPGTSPWTEPGTDPGTNPGTDPGTGGGCYPDGHACQAGGDCCNGNCIDQSVNDWICY